jgi:hypothetical protein
MIPEIGKSVCHLLVLSGVLKAAGFCGQALRQRVVLAVRGRPGASGDKSNFDYC